MTALHGAPVLVTGAAGLVGSNLVRRLLAEGSQVRATLYRRSPVVEDERIEYVWADLSDEAQCENVVAGRRFVFHCAANTSGAATIAATPIVHVTPNVVMNARLLQAAYDAGVEKVLWLSSTTGYPPTDDRPVREEEMFHGDPYDAYFCVGWMKRFTEVLCRMYAERLKEPITAIVLRPTNIYGPGDDFDPRTSHATAALIRKVVERKDPIEVWGTGDDVRDLIYVEDMVEAIVRGIERLSGWVAVNIGLGEGHSLNQVLQHLLEIDGYNDARVIFDPSKPSTIPVRLVDVEKARQLLGFHARVGLREGLQRTIEWYRSNRGLLRTASSRSY